jgi:hypothetical protein
MKRMLLLLCLSCRAALGQPADCATVPLGPSTPMQIRIGPLARPGLPAGAQASVKLDLDAASGSGTVCPSRTVPPADVLRGEPAPRGLLLGDGPRDVLHDAPVGRVTVEMAPEK